jgi:hypothetical protein
VSDIGSVHSYAQIGIRRWAEHRRPCGVLCPCLICADTRAYFDLSLEPNINRVMVAPNNTREERAAS